MYSLIALVSDYDCWMPHTPGTDKKVLLKEIIANMNIACNNCVSLIESVLSSDHVLNGHNCICREVLSWPYGQTRMLSKEQEEKMKVLFE